MRWNRQQDIGIHGIKKNWLRRATLELFRQGDSRTVESLPPHELKEREMDEDWGGCAYMTGRIGLTDYMCNY